MHQIARILILLMLIPAGLSAQTPATTAALEKLSELEKDLTKVRNKVAELRTILANAPACPACPTCPPPVVCSVINCTLSAWGAWSAWAPVSPTQEARTRTRTILTPASNGGTCTEPLTETETRSIVLPGTVTVSTASQLLAALKLSHTTVKLEPGTYVGNFVISGSGVQVIGASLPETRVQANATAGYQLVPSDRAQPALTITGSDVTVTGLTIGQGQEDRAMVVVGSSLATDPLQQPNNVTLDRLELTAGALGGKRGMELNARSITVKRSRILNFWRQNEDSQAILIVNGPGPYLVEDNQLQASGENIMSGGSSIRSAAMVPGGIVIRGNLIDKPQEWRTKRGSVKNSVEFKAARGALLENNLIDGMWLDAQSGHAIVITPRNQYDDSPWTVVEDIVVKGNKVINHTDGFFANILGTDNIYPSQQTSRITIEGNYGDSNQGIKVTAGVAGWLRIRNNTWPRIKGSALNFDNPAVLIPFEFTRNVLSAGYYGIQGQALGSGVEALNVYCQPGWVVQGNVIEQPVRSAWPYTAPNTNRFLSGPGLLAPLLDAEGHYTPDRSLGW
jgi:hypothetical protein